MNNFFEWSDDLTQKLRELWTQGFSTNEIGRRLGVSKNAVIGKDRRINLERRPSPIVQSSPGKTSTGKRFLRNRGTAGRGSMAAYIPPELSREPSPPRPSDSPCCWPIGEPGRTGFRYCDEPTRRGRSYCEAHRAIALRNPTGFERAALNGKGTGY